MAHAEIQGAASKGMMCFMKHFAVNDQETNRQGVATWLNEQSMREIYLLPFELAIKNNVTTIAYNALTWDSRGNIIASEQASREIPAAMAIMTSFNRIGTTWAGGDYALLTAVLRNEWGFYGIVLTDYCGDQTHMDTAQMLYAGGDAKLRTINSGFNAGTIRKDSTLLTYMREAFHRYLYAQANSAAMNGIVRDVSASSGVAVYKLMLITLDVVTLVILAVIWLPVVRKKKTV